MISSRCDTLFCSSVAYKELHLRDLLVNLLHELDYEVHQLMLQHLFGMEVRNQEGDIVALRYSQHSFFLLRDPSSMCGVILNIPVPASSSK